MSDIECPRKGRFCEYAREICELLSAESISLGEYWLWWINYRPREKTNKLGIPPQSKFDLGELIRRLGNFGIFVDEELLNYAIELEKKTFGKIELSGKWIVFIPSKLIPEFFAKTIAKLEESSCASAKIPACAKDYAKRELPAIFYLSTALDPFAVVEVACALAKTMEEFGLEKSLCYKPNVFTGRRYYPESVCVFKIRIPSTTVCRTI